MESIKSSTLKSKEEVINDLRHILELVNEGKESYRSASEATENFELKALFLKLSGERIVYAAELEEHILLHSKEVESGSDSIGTKLKRTWQSIKHTFNSHEDMKTLSVIAKSERAVVEEYNKCIADYADHADHLSLLTEQRDGILVAVAELEKQIVQQNG